MILRVCVVIPTYNNARTISEVVKDVLLTTPFPVLVVDDGSDTPVSGALYSWDVRGALEAGRVRVVRFEKNRGKGAALRFAISELASQGYTHMMAMDGDGQHFAREIHKLDANDAKLLDKIVLSKDAPGPHDMCLGKKHRCYCGAGIAVGANDNGSPAAGYVCRIDF